MWKLALLGLLSLFRATHQQYYPPNHHSEDDHDDAKLNSTVNVEFPLALRHEIGYVHSDALFGQPNFGSRLSDQLLFAASDSDPEGLLCEVGNGLDFPKPYIMLARRGECTFVTKARHAQQMGAAALVLVDHTCYCEDEDSGKCTGSEYACEDREPSLGDDNSGGDIKIPTVMLKKQEGEDIISNLKDGNPITLSIVYNVPDPDDRVEWNLWTDPIDFENSAQFKQEFGEIVDNFGLSAFFEPFYWVYNGTSAGCRFEAQMANGPCGDMCTNLGRYCFVDPDGVQNYGVSGADVVEEVLRQKCIYQEYGGIKAAPEQYGIASKWWAYAKKFSEDCDFEETFNKDCARDTMKSVKIDQKRIDDCISLSGGIETKGPENDVLEYELAQRAKQQVSMMPAYTVNGARMEGSVSSAAVFDAICAGFKPGTAPDPLCSCVGEATEQEIASCASSGSPSNHQSSGGGSSGGGGGSNNGGGVSGGGVAGIVIAVMAVTAMGAFAYIRYHKLTVQNEVRDLLAEYMPLEDGSQDVVA